ncbi:NAD-dependent epimerase/dehydratase family protein [soil metagenome]
MNNDKKNILLLGGAGYLGSHLRNQFSSYNVYFTSRTAINDAIALDLLDETTFQNIATRSYDCIILLASSLKGLGTTELKKEYLDTDSIGLPQFLQFVSKNKLTDKLVFISSMTVYGIGNSLPVKETASLEPLSTYGLSKIVAEKVIDFHCKSNSTKGVILRIPGIYGGERNSGFIYNTAIKCLRNEARELDIATLGYWETIHIEDVSVWIASFIANYNWQATIDVFNIGYGTKTDFIECANLIKENLKSNSEISIKGTKGYCDFFLDNTKVKQHVPVKDKYKESLETYLKKLSV